MGAHVSSAWFGSVVDCGMTGRMTTKASNDMTSRG
jgi:hypothetical protein